MKPVETTYHLAVKPHDYKACRKLMEEVEGKPYEHSLSYPTIYAKRDGEVIGFLGTIPDDKAVIAGPLVVNGGRNPITVMRLVEAYDLFMASQGIKLYYFAVDSGRDDAMRADSLKRLGYVHWGTVDNIEWYKKEL